MTSASTETINLNSFKDHFYHPEVIVVHTFHSIPTARAVFRCMGGRVVTAPPLDLSKFGIISTALLSQSSLFMVLPCSEIMNASLQNAHACTDLEMHICQH